MPIGLRRHGLEIDCVVATLSTGVCWAARSKVM